MATGAAEPCLEGGPQEKKDEEAKVFQVSVLGGLVISVLDVCDQGIYTFIPGYCEKLGIEKATTGMILGMNGLGIMLLSPFVPSFFKYFGGDKETMFFGLVGFLVTRLVLIPLQWVSSVSFFQVSLIVIFGITSFFYAICEVSVISWVMTAVSAKDRTQAFGTLVESRAVGAIVGPIMGGACFSWGGWAVTFAVFAASVAGSAVYMRTNPVYLQDDRAGKDTLSGTGGIILRDKRVFLTWVMFGVMMIPLSFVFVIMQPLLEFKFGVQPWGYGLITTSAIGVVIAGAELSKVVEKTIGSLAGIGISMAPLCISFLLMGPSPLLPFLPSALWVQVAGQWTLAAAGVIPLILLPPLTQQYAIDAGFDEATAAAQNASLNVTSAGVCLLLGPVVAGSLSQTFGSEWALTMYGIAQTIIMVLLLALTKMSGPKTG